MWCVTGNLTTSYFNYQSIPQLLSQFIFTLKKYFYTIISYSLVDKFKRWKYWCWLMFRYLYQLTVSETTSGVVCHCYMLFVTRVSGKADTDTWWSGSVVDLLRRIQSRSSNQVKIQYVVIDELNIEPALFSAAALLGNTELLEGTNK